VDAQDRELYRTWARPSTAGALRLLRDTERLATATQRCSGRPSPRRKKLVSVDTRCRSFYRVATNHC